MERRLPNTIRNLRAATNLPVAARFILAVSGHT